VRVGSRVSSRALIVMAISLFLLAAVGMGTLAIQVESTSNFIDCEKGYNEDVARAFLERQKAADEDRKALRLVASSGTTALQTVLNPAASVEVKTKAIQDWVSAQTQASDDLTKADARRAANPIPAPRKC
jgi:hypothetical protein